MIQSMLIVLIIVLSNMNSSAPDFLQRTIQATDVNELVVRAVNDIGTNGVRSPATGCIQTYDVNYVLNPSVDEKSANYRVPFIRGPKGISYFAKELLAYFNGSSSVGPLLRASSDWRKLADENGKVNSNYGTYIFHQKLPQHPDKTQLDWVLEWLLKDLYSRKGFIAINQVEHKNLGSKDFPCIIGVQFYVQEGYFMCAVLSRSTFILSGLSYDMGFFSFVHELVYRLLLKRLPFESGLKFGYLVMKTNFTQIPQKTEQTTFDILKTDWNSEIYDPMPLITDPEATLSDIYNGTYTTTVMQWIAKYAK